MQALVVGTFSVIVKLRKGSFPALVLCPVPAAAAGVSAVSICSPELLAADDSCALDSADIGRAAAACPV